MPPKKKAKGASGAVAAVESPIHDPHALTPDGIEGLKLLTQHRPQRLQVGGVHLGIGSAADAAPPPPPVTLQIIQINRYFIDQRFWSLVGVPYPTLPKPNLLQQPQEQKDEEMGVGNGNGDGGHVGAPVPGTNALPGFDQYSDLHVAYDLILSDGRFQLKVVLSPTLALHLEKGGLMQYGIIQVVEASVRYDETIVAGPGVHVIKQMNIIEEKANDIILADPATPLSFPPWVNVADMLNKPLIGGPRSYYLSLYNDDTILFDPSNYPPFGEAERIDAEQKRLLGHDVSVPMEEDLKEGASAPSSSPPSQRKKKGGAPAPIVEPARLITQDARLEEPRMLTRADVVTIKELLSKGVGYQHGDKSIGQTLAQTSPLLGAVKFLLTRSIACCCLTVCRVFAKSRILNFGRKSANPSRDMLRAPFSFELLVGDESNEQIKIVLWNTLVGAYFHRVHIGQLVAIRGFRLKHARSDNQFELALNPYNPIGSIRVLEGLYSVEPSVGEHIPPITMTVSTIAIVKSMPDDSYFDLAGVVTYAGPMLREWSQPKNQFFQYRWLKLVDTSGTDSLAVKLYTNSQQQQLESIRVTEVVYLSNLTLTSANSPTLSAPSARSILAKSTNYTQILDQPAQEATQHPYLLQLHKWSQEVNHGDLAFYPSLYVWNLDFDHYKQTFSDSITPMREVRGVQESLRFQQLKSVLLQGFLSEIILHPAGLRPIEEGVMTQEDYDDALKRLYPPSEEQKQAEPIPSGSPSASPSRRSRKSPAASPPARVDPNAMVDVAPSASPRTTAASSRHRASADTEIISASQQSTGSAAGRRGRSRTGAAEEKQPDQDVDMTQRSTRSRAGSAAGGKTSRSASRSKSKGKGGKGKKGASTKKKSSSKKRAASASAADSKAQIKGGKVVKEVARKRKAERSPTPAAATAGEVAASAAVPITAALPIPVSAAAAAAGPVAVSPAPILHPSIPSVLATLVLRDLNGETFLQVELHDPILPHASFEGAKGNISEKCETPKEAARVFLGLSHLLPGSTFTPDSWHNFMVAASVPPKSTKKISPAERLKLSVQQLHDVVLATLAPKRLLASVNMTRTSYRQVESRIVTIFQAEE